MIDFYLILLCQEEEGKTAAKLVKEQKARRDAIRTELEVHYSYHHIEWKFNVAMVSDIGATRGYV